jgi:hypothetical protein
MGVRYARARITYNVHAREKNEYAVASKTNMPQHLKRSYFLSKNSFVLDAKWLRFR